MYLSLLDPHIRQIIDTKSEIVHTNEINIDYTYKIHDYQNYDYTDNLLESFKNFSIDDSYSIVGSLFNKINIINTPIYIFYEFMKFDNGIYVPSNIDKKIAYNIFNNQIFGIYIIK